MELLNLHYFMTVSRYSNFTKAAKATYTSQSNISKQIASLEKELGVPLFIRNKTGVELTPAGEYLFNGLRTLLPQLDLLLENTTTIQENLETPIIKLGLCSTMDLERIIPNFIARLRAYIGDNLMVEFSSYQLDEIGEKLVVGAIDCAFMFNVEGWSHPDAQRLPINRANPMLYYSEKHPLFGKSNLSVEDFRDEVFIQTTDKDGPVDQYEALPFQPKKWLREKSMNTVFLYISSGTAVGVYGPSQTMLERNDIHTIELPTENKVGTDAVWLTTNTNPALKDFIDFLKQL